MGRAKWDKKHRAWRKLHIAAGPDRGKVVAHELTGDSASDASPVDALVARLSGRIRPVFADEAYDGAPIYTAIRSARPSGLPPRIVIPPRTPSIR